MKVRYTKDSKRALTLDDLDAARKMIEYVKDDDINEIATMVVNMVLAMDTGRYNQCERILEAKAEVSKNCRIWNWMDDTKDIDIWIEAVAMTSEGFMTVGFYLTDAYTIGPEDSNREARFHMYARRFTEVTK